MYVLLFFLSGAAALVYQTAWQRILALGSGVGLYSVAMIVAAFMAGLGLGSHGGGLLSTRVTARRALLLFGLVEAAIGVLGALSPWLLYDVLYRRGSWLFAVPARAGFVHFATLLLPTSLMGMSLPLLVRGSVRDAATAARTVGNLYGVNTLGAAFGAVASPWLLVRFLGLDGAVYTAAATNLAVGVTAMLLARGAGAGEETASAPSVDSETAEAPGLRPLRLWLALYCASGFVALSLEILWFRIVDVAVKSSAFTFGTVLALYLLGLGLGALVGARVAPRVAHPLRSFLVCQCALLLASAATIVALVRLPAASLAWFYQYWSRYEGVTLGRDASLSDLLRLYVLVPLLLYGLPTLLMGFVFPILQRAVHDEVATSGRKVGLLQAANIVGCVAGSLLVGLVSLQWLGSSGTLRLLLVAGVGFAVVGARYYGLRDGFGAWAAALGIAMLLVPGQDALWSRLHGVAPSRALLAEDASSVAAITPETEGGTWRVSVNGKGNSQLPYGSFHTYLGAVPALIHEAPLDVAVIGLGSGDTAWAAACRPETRSLTVFELSRPQPLLLHRLLERDPLPPLWSLLHDPRLRLVLDDGRSSLDHSVSSYDMIEADALRPTSAGSGNLYSVEFFESCARRLKPGGLVCTWAPTARVYASFCRVFPGAIEMAIGDKLLVGGRETIAIDRGSWRARLDSPEVTARLGPEIAARVLAVLRTARHADASAIGAHELDTDLFPRDEFLSP